MNHIENLKAIKAALPHIGRTDTKVLVALLGYEKPLTVNQIHTLIGQKAFSVFPALVGCGLLESCGYDLYRLADPAHWEPTEIKAFRIKQNEEVARRAAERREAIKAEKHRAYLERLSERRARKSNRQAALT